MKTFLELLFSFTSIFSIIIIEIWCSCTGKNKRDRLEKVLVISGTLFVLSTLAYMLLYV